MTPNFALLLGTPTTKIAAGGGLIRRILLGAGEKILPKAERLISASGRMLPRVSKGGPSFRSLFSAARKPGDVGTFAKNLFIGHNPVGVLKQRALQGGILGKGGIVRSTMAMPEAIAADAKTMGLGKSMLKHPGHTAGWGLAAGFTAGMPAYTVSQDIAQGNLKNIPASLAKGMAWGVAEPFSLVGQLGVLPAAEHGLGALAEKGVSSAAHAVKPHAFSPSIPKLTKSFRSIQPPKPRLSNISPYNFA